MSDTRERQGIRDALEALHAVGRHMARSRGTRGVMIHQARRVQAEAVNVVTLAVLAERKRGASWAEVAEALGESVEFVVAHYRPIEERWTAGLGVDPVVHPATDEQVAHGS